ncbi:MAG: InlB B-repeat-containing protein [Clostridia bacterium]|nr:InlB B-repeat-containing protein [Clostridia bacterium]
MLFYGCDKNAYKNMSLSIEGSTDMEVVLNDDPSLNLFTVTALVSKMPKGYDGAVSFSVPVNDFISLKETSNKVEDGRSRAVFEAKQQGGPVAITVKTLEGNLTTQVNVKVVKPVTSISFNSQIIPVIKGEQTDISKYLTFNAGESSTNQTGVKLELISESNSDKLIQVVTDGHFLTVPSELDLSEFQIRARSTVNPEIVSSTLATVKVITVIPTSQITLMHNNNTPDISDDDLAVEKVNSTDYGIVLATNTGNLFTKTLYFNFANNVNENNNYSVGIKGLTESGAILDENNEENRIVEAVKVPNKLNWFNINARGNGKTKIEFIIERSDFPGQFTQTITLNIDVQAFPTEISVSNISTNEKLDYIQLYANYNESTTFGTPFRVVVSNETGAMTNQKVIVNVSSFAENNIQLYDSNKNLVQFGSELISNGQYYLKHNFTEAPQEEIKLNLESVTYSQVFTDVLVLIETQPIELTTSRDTVNIDITKGVVETKLEVLGLPSGFNYLNLSYELLKDDVSDASKLVSISKTASQIAVAPKTTNIGIGECKVKVIAPNGSYQIYTIVLYESLNTAQTSVTIAGVTIDAQDVLDAESATEINVKNGLNIQVYFNINGKEYSSLAGTGLSYKVTSSNNQVVQNKQVSYQLQTQNMAGASHVVIEITGFNDSGQKNKVVYFEAYITVSVPLANLFTNESETVLYDTNSLAVSQQTTYGTYTINLSSSPVNATFTFDDIEWICEYNGTELLADTDISQDKETVIYTFRTINFDTIRLTTTKSNFKQAVVTCEISGSSTQMLTFNIVARVQQEFTNENGYVISAPKTASVRFLVYRAVRVSDFVFENVASRGTASNPVFEITYDERDLDYDGSKYNNTANCIKTINFTVYPANALNKDLGVTVNNSAISVGINNVNKTITVQLLYKPTSTEPITITVYAKDDFDGGQIGKHKIIKIRVLDGRSVESAFEVKNQADLEKVSSSLSAHYVLAGDIALSSNWTPIGYSQLGTQQFNGYFSGKYEVKDENDTVVQTSYYSITGLTINNNSYEYYGLFAYLGSNSQVSDLTINGVSITANITHNKNVYAGALAGYAEGTITNVSVNDQSGVQSYTGVYYNNNEKGSTDFGIYITANTNTSEHANYFVGGLVGFVNNAALYDASTTVASSLALFNNVKTNYSGSSLLNTQIANAKVVAQLNVHVKTNNISFVGGVVGFNNRAVISANNSTALSFGSDSANVITAINASLTPEQTSFNEYSAFGGVAGFNNGIIDGITAKASIFGVYEYSGETYNLRNVGGIVGYNTGSITNNTAFPLIHAYENIGGVVGKTVSAVVSLDGTVGETDYSFVNGKMGVGDGKFTMGHSIEFNSNFKVVITEFKTESLTYDELVEVLTTQYSSKDTAEDYANNAYNRAIPNTYTVTKVSKLNMFSDVADKVVYAYRYGSYAINSSSDYDGLTTNQIALSLGNYGTNTISGNSVQFLELNDGVKLFNTALVGMNNVGGLIGEYVGVYAVNEDVAPFDANSSVSGAVAVSHVNYNPIAYNSVYNYTQKTVVQTNAVVANSFYGNILLSNAYVSEVKPENRNYAGGLVGKLTNGAIYANQVFASLQGNLAALGGLVGKTDGITSISNSSFVGTIINRDTDATAEVAAITGGLVGDALSATTTFAYYGKANDDETLLDTNILGSLTTLKYSYGTESVGYVNLGTTYNNIAYSYFRAQTPSGYVASVAEETTNYINQKSVGYVGAGRRELNLTYAYADGSIKTFTVNETDLNYNPTLTDVLKVNTTTVKTSASETEVFENSFNFDGATIDETKVNTFIAKTQAYVVTELAIDDNGDGLSDEHTSNGTGDIYKLTSAEFIDAYLKNTVWYVNYQLNDGLPVLLTPNKLVVTESGYSINLLSNFPPTDIILELKQNMVDTFITSLGANSASVIYFYGLADSNYQNSSSLNFGTTDEDKIKNSTTELNAQLAKLNTYSIAEVLNLTTIPSFVNANSFKLTSSNPSVLSVGLDEQNNIKFVAKGAGTVVITISSVYNTSLTKSIFVNVANATNSLKLGYFASGEQKYVQNNQILTITKSTDDMQITLPLSSNFASSYDFNGIIHPEIKKTFALKQNINSGVRYYLTALSTIESVTYSSIYHFTNDIESLIDSIPVTINNSKFEYEYVNSIEDEGVTTNYYTVYIDVPYGNTANVVGLVETVENLNFVAVPYVVTNITSSTKTKQLLASIGEYNDVENAIELSYVHNNEEKVEKVLGLTIPTQSSIVLNKTRYGVETYSYADYKQEYLKHIDNLVTKFSLKVAKATWNITKSLDEISFDVKTIPTFSIEIETDKDTEELYVVYYENLGSESKERVVPISTIIDGDSSFGGKVQISNITMLVNNHNISEVNGKNVITYNFSLLVSDELKTEIQDVFTTSLRFFVAKQGANITYDGEYVNNAISSITTANLLVELPVTLLPQSITEITLKHYPNSESTVTTDDNGNKITNVNLNEIAYDNLIPGNAGILKAYISPYYSSFDELRIISSGSGANSVLFEQMLAHTTKTAAGILYTGNYTTLITQGNQVDGGITLQKISYIQNAGEESELQGYDGNIYIRTLVNSYITEADNFTLTLTAYKNGVVVKTASITLEVQTPPSLNLSINGDKFAPIARGTEIGFDAKLNDLAGMVDFSQSYMFRYNSNGMEVRVGSINSDFTIKTSGGNYSVSVNNNIASDRYIKIIGVVTKQINGEIIEHTDSITLHVTDFVIEEITVENATAGNYVGLFNQPYALIVRINKATYNPENAETVAEQIQALELEFSKCYEENSVLTTWKSVNTSTTTVVENRYGSLQKGYNTAKTFIIGTRISADLNNTAVYTLQNTRFGSGDKLAAVVQYVYTDNGIKALMTSEDRANYETNAYCYEKTYEFGFGFYRIRDEERPDPIETAEQFKNMEDGVDYILVNDIVLEDWEPFRDDLAINSLDGNGYVITIKNFKLDAFESVESLINTKNIGIFGKINAGTTIKNLIIEVPAAQKANSIELATYAGTAVDLYVDAKAYKTVNFGILAGTNSGLVTNVQIVNDAGALREERELAIAYSDPSNPLYANYFDGVTFDKNAFIIANWNKFHANEVYKTVSATDKTPLLDGNDELIIESLAGSENRQLSVVRIDTTATTDVQAHYMAGLVGQNLDGGTDALGTITNSSIENITINGVGNVAGFVAVNNGKISTSYFKGGNVINHTTEQVAELATSGFVITNSGTNAAIQYSYVQGRIGEKVKFANPKTGLAYTNASNIDKTGLNDEAKSAFAGYTYYQSSTEPGFQASVATLRALNAMIDTRTNASAFIYENAAIISNSYANIMVNSTMQTSGFVFSNTEEGTISSCYTLSSIRTKNQSASPFTGRTSNYEGYNNANPEGFNDCHYLKLGCDENATALEISLKEDFIDSKEPATALGSSQFAEYNTFQGYAFNTDFEKSSADKLTRSVWFIPNDQSKTLYKEYFKNSYYINARPELVAANMRTVSIRVWIGSDESEENSYNYVSNELVLGASIKNPILIKSAEDFNRYLNYETTNEDVDRNFAVRFISDIAFNKTDLTAQTYNMEYYGDLDGNGMTINQLRLVSDTDFENPNTGETITHLGLFGKIKTKDPDAEVKERGVVRNLNINVSEVRGSKVTYVGALAGSIENADVFNINISGDEVIQGKNLVGGLAGIIKGDSEIVNITSSLSAKAAYFKDTNKFLGVYPNATLLPKEFGTFNLYYSELQGDEVSNVENVSYAGGIAGVFDVKEREEDEQLSPLSLFNAKARKLIVSGNITLIGEIVGGVFGLNGIESTASDLSFIVGEANNPELKGSRVVGGLIGENRGEIERSYVAHDTTLQEKIDAEYGNAVTSGTNPTVNNSTLNYNGLYAGNAHYTGGVVGFNNGGRITNVYSKMNVINMNTMYAGGIVGLSIGGQYNFIYTTGTVSGFKSAGGFAGLQTSNPYNAVEDTSGAETQLVYSLHNRYTSIYIEPNKHNGAIVAKGASKYVGIVAANIWRSQDLVTSRVEQNAEDLSIGTLIGMAADRTMTEALDGGTYPNINNIVEVSDLSARMMNETVFFTQPFIVSNQHDSAYSGFDMLMPEVGSFNTKYLFNTRTRGLSKDYRFSNSVNPETGKNSTSAADADKVSSTYDANTDPLVTNMTRPMGLSGYLAQPKMDKDGYYLVDGVKNTSLASPDKTVDRTYYHYSRLQNIGSARTLKEIITSLDIISSEAYVCGDLTDNAGSTVLDEVNTTSYHAYDETYDTIETSGIFETWNTNRWTGVRKESAADLATVFPFLEAKPEKTLIQVYNVTHLKLMSTYVNAEFQLMNDIDLLETVEGDDTTGGNWEPVGTKAIPFKGILHSNPAVSDIYTIYNLSVTNAPENYAGLVAYANEAEFKNFNLSKVILDVEGSNDVPLFMGALVGYAVSGTIINNVDITTAKGSGAVLTTETAGTMGGLVGYSEIGTVTNCNIESVTINANGFGDLSKLETERDKTLAFGGAIGYITSAVVDLPMVSNVSIESGDVFIRAQDGTSLNMLADSYFGGDASRSFDVGGVIGRSNNSDSDYGRVTGISSALTITTKLARNANTAITDVNVGGLIGKAQNTMLTEEGWMGEDGLSSYKQRNFVNGTTGKTPSNGIVVELDDYKDNLYVGGAVGSIYGATKITLGVEYQTDDLSQVVVGKSRALPINLTINGGDPTTYVGGVAGLAQNVASNNLYANSTIAITDKTTAECVLSAGGLIGEINNGQYVKNAQSLGSVSYTSEVKGTNGVNLGGAFGNVIMADLEGTPGVIEKVIANSSVIGNTTSDGSNYRTMALGGFAGKMFSGQISQSVSSGLVKLLNANKNNQNYVGGFVGKLDINSEVQGNSSFPHTISITNSYATNDVQATSMFESSNASYAGLFVGNIAYGYKKNVKNQITLLNNYTIGKFVYSADGTFYDSFYNEKTNKGGFLGGFEYYVSGVNSTNIQRAKNLVFRNNFYNSDFVPYTNGYMEGVVTQQMLLDANTDFKNKFEASGVWTTAAGAYPMLTWINDSADAIDATNMVDSVKLANTVAGYNVTSYQTSGSKVKPATSYSNSSQAFILEANPTAGTSMSNKTVYFTKSTNGLKLGVVDERSLIYGIHSTTASDYIIATNNGFVVGSSILAKLATTNNGVIYRVTFNAQTGFNTSAFAVTTNNGVIDTMVAEDTFSSAVAGSKLISVNNGVVYRSLIKNKKLSFAGASDPGKIKSSYYLSDGSSSAQTNANYYDQMGSLYSYKINDTADTSYKFDLANFETNILDISGMDFANDFIIIKGNTAKLNYGAPIFRYELHSEDTTNGGFDFDGEIISSNYWIHSTGRNWNYIKNNYVDTIIKIDTPEELAEVAQAVTLGNQTGLVTEEVEISVTDDAALISDESTSEDGADCITITTTEYNFGVAVTKVREFLDFEGQTIQLEDDIDLSGRLWTPIGFGFDNYEVGVGSSYATTLNDSSHNMFKGSFDGCGYVITGVTSVESNKNVGLFGTVYANSVAKYTLANIVVRDSNFISVSSNGGFSVAGAIAGRVVLDVTDVAGYASSNPLKVLTKVGTEHANVFATNRASGLIGDLLNVTGSIGSTNANIYLASSFEYAYVNSNVATSYNSGVSSAFIHFGNNSKYDQHNSIVNSDMSYIKQMYISGKLGDYRLDDSNKYAFVSQETDLTSFTTNSASIDSVYGLFTNITPVVTVNNLYAIALFDDTFMNSQAMNITSDFLQTEALGNFDWGNVWTRQDGVNNNYPTLISKVKYWAEIVTASDAPSLSETTYTISTNKQLAWLAHQVNVEDKNFSGYTFKLNADIDLNNYIWSPIGYGDQTVADSVYRQFRGTFDFNGKTIKNLVTAGVYIKTSDLPEELKGNYTTEELSSLVVCVDENKAGLFGYTYGATLTSSAGSGKIGTESLDYSFIVSKGNAGALVAYAQDTNISNITNYASVSATYNSYVNGVAGLIGKTAASTNVTYTNLVNHAQVRYNSLTTDKSANAAGVAGYIVTTLSGSVAINNSRNTGEIYAANGAYVGGIVGGASTGLTINGLGNYSANTTGTSTIKDNTSNNPDNSGEIVGYRFVGGIVGGYSISGATTRNVIENVTNTGTIIAVSSGAGGILGRGNAYVYEAVNAADVKGTQNVGGIIGESINSPKIANLLNKGSVYSYNSTLEDYEHQETGSSYVGLLIGKIDNNAQNNIYSVIDVSTEQNTVYLFGNSTTTYPSHAIMSAHGIKSSNNLNENSIYNYGGAYVKVQEVFTDSLVWDNVVEYANGSVDKNQITLNYKQTPAGTAPTKSGTTYEVESLENLKYMGGLNRKRYGISSVSGDMSIINSFDIVNLQPLGGGVYPWKCDVVGGNKTLTIKSINTAYDNCSLFGDVLGNVRADKSVSDYVEIKNLKIKYNASTSISFETGMLADIASGLKAVGIEISGSGLTTSANFGSIASNGTSLKLENCSNSLNISSSGSRTSGLIPVVGADESNSEIKTSSNTGNITYTGSSHTAVVGGLVAESKNTTFIGCANGASKFARVKYEGNIQESLIERVSTIKGPIVGGIVGSSTNDSIGVSGDAYGEFNYGNVKSETSAANNSNASAGGIVGCAINSKVYDATNSGLIEAENYAGGIAGKMKKETIDNAENTILGEVISSSIAGGIIGLSESVKISNAKHCGFVASRTFNTLACIGGIAGKITGASSSVKIAGTVEGYVGVYQKTAPLTYTDATSAATYTFNANYYYTDYNVDDPETGSDKKYKNLDEQNGAVKFEWDAVIWTELGAAQDADSKGVASDAYRNAVYNIGYIAGSSNTEDKSIVNVSVTKPEDKLVLHDYYVSAEYKDDGEIMWWYNNWIRLTGKDRYGEPQEFGKCQLNPDANNERVSTAATDGEKGYVTDLWGHTSGCSHEINNGAPTNSVAANTPTPVYYFEFQDVTSSGTSFGTHYTGAKTKYYAGQQIALPTASEEGYELTHWSKSTNASDTLAKVENGTTVNSTNFTFEDKDGKQTETLYAHWSKQRISVSLYGKDGKYEGETKDVYSIGGFTIEYGSSIPHLENMQNHPEIDSSLLIRDGYRVTSWHRVPYTVWNDWIDTANDGSLTDKSNAKKSLENYISDWKDAEKVEEGADYVGTGYEKTKVLSSDTFTNPITIYAFWLRTITISFNGNYTGAPTYESVEVAKGNTIALAEVPTPTRTGYEFVGWYKNAAGSGSAVNFETETFGSDTTLYAKWQGVEVHVSYINNVTGNTIDSTIVRNGELLINVPSEEVLNGLVAGYTFKEWKVGSNVINVNTYRLDVGSNTTLSVVAHFTKNAYTVKFIENFKGSTTALQTKSVEHGGKVTAFANPTRTGYEFKGWYYSDDTAYSFDDVITASTNVYAKWEAIDVEIYFYENVSTGSWIAYGSEVVGKYDDPISPLSPVPEFPGYRFDGYFLEEACTTELDLESGSVTFAENEQIIYLKYVKQVTITFMIEKTNAAGDSAIYSIAIDSGTRVSDEVNSAIVNSSDYLDIYDSTSGNYITTRYPDLFTANSMSETTALVWVEYNVGTGQATDTVIDLESTIINSDITLMLKFLT